MPYLRTPAIQSIPCSFLPQSLIDSSLNIQFPVSGVMSSRARSGFRRSLSAMLGFKLAKTSALSASGSQMSVSQCSNKRIRRLSQEKDQDVDSSRNYMEDEADTPLINLAEKAKSVHNENQCDRNVLISLAIVFSRFVRSKQRIICAMRESIFSNNFLTLSFFDGHKSFNEILTMNRSELGVSSVYRSFRYGSNCLIKEPKANRSLAFKLLLSSSSSEVRKDVSLAFSCSICCFAWCTSLPYSTASMTNFIRPMVLLATSMFGRVNECWEQK